MYNFLVFLFPSLLGIKIMLHLNKENKLIDILINYGLLTLISNLICMIILFVFNKGEYDLLTYASTNFVFCIKYIVMMLVVNVFLSILFHVISKYVYLDVEVKNEKKKSINNN